MSDLQAQQLESLATAQEQQLASLTEMRAAALENAKYWEGLADQAAQAQAETAAAAPAPAPQATPTTWVNAHFDYLDKVVKAQFDYARALVGQSPSE